MVSFSGCPFQELARDYVVGFYGELIYSPLPARILALLAKLNSQDHRTPMSRERRAYITSSCWCWPQGNAPAGLLLARELRDFQIRLVPMSPNRRDLEPNLRAQATRTRTKARRADPRRLLGAHHRGRRGGWGEAGCASSGSCEAAHRRPFVGPQSVGRATFAHDDPRHVVLSKREAVCCSGQNNDRSAQPKGTGADSCTLAALSRQRGFA